MSDRYDVAARLAEGEPAAARIQTYVQACHSLGYQQPELTAHASQVGDWYGTEVGLDLRVLDADVAELRAAATAIDEALWVQRTQVTELAAAWRGSGAESATRFLQRHCDLAEEVAGHVRAAAEQCATLRDDLWQAIDGKVATTVAIDERHSAQRSTWLAAARAVTTGGGERSTAELVVQREVMPFVDNDIRNDWLAAMSAANASVAASYDDAIHALASTRDVRFDIPDDLGPRWQPDERPTPPAAPVMSLPASPSPTIPAAAPAAPQPTPEAPQQLPADDPDPLPPAPTSPLGDAAGLSSGAGGLGGLGGMTGGLGGIVGSIVDGIGSLLGLLAGGSDESLGDDPVDLDDDDPLLDDVDEPDDAGLEPVALDENVVPEAPAVECPPLPANAVAEPAAQPVDPPPPDAPPADPPPAAEPAADGSTPCEIAEDQLPQAGQ
ncbi:hypothetical protein A5658_15620 [Mycobacterium sp. 1245111.1]|uniref:hypothetical protein n=1 Tax=Mycobacterium sp. 1245111.1 TaxID=1834073 RepID=UPI0007FC327A|nr:hypothetical protein [Mycobacterium sp. 1245111.1]OBK32473.1 hypothetical protein A5658_15620 [Mycobacterium sp. 1245111.1]